MGCVKSLFLRIAISVWCALVASHVGWGAEAVAEPQPRSSLWFPVGEELVYNISWGRIPVGRAVISTGWQQENGVNMLVIRYRALSNRAIAKIYPVDSSIESLIDPVTFHSIRFVKNMREGRRRYHEVTVFDYETLKGHWKSLISKKERTFALESDTRDLVAFLYYVRSAAFSPGDDLKYRVMADDDIYDLRVKVGKVEDVDVPGFGKVPSLRIEPEAAFNGIFVRKGKMTVWVSDDERMVFTKILAELPFANVRAVLSAVHGPGDDFWTKNTKH